MKTKHFFTTIGLTIISIILLTNSASAQELVVTGTQSKGGLGSSEFKIECDGITLPMAAKIEKITGFNNGFWIKKDGETIKKFKGENATEAVGYTLPKGTYYVYPYLKQNQHRATVTLTLSF